MHYEGKKGFVSVAQKRSEGRTLNLSQLSDILDKLIAEKKAQTEGGKVVVDLTELGIRKILGSGSINRPVQVKVSQCSEGALKKIKEAGGEAILPTQAQ